MAPHAPWNSSDSSDKARKDLLLLLEGVRGQDGGKKNLVLEKSLAGPLNLLVKFSTLQECGVEKVFFLENENLDTSQRNVVFLARGEKSKTVFRIAEQIKKVRSTSHTDHSFSIFWAPRRTRVSDMILEEAGVLGEVSISEFPLYFVPLADDLLSLELDDAFSDLYLRKDPTATFLSAKALMQFQLRHGLFPRIMGKGDNAKRLLDLLIRMRSELTATEDSGHTAALVGGLTPSTVVESLIVIDREVDIPTVLHTQLTYEGLIDEVYPIKANQTELPTSITGTTSQQSQQSNTGPTPSAPQSSMKRKIFLDPSDSLYSTLQDANFATVGPLLNKVARRLQTTYESRHTAARSTAELREFVAKLPGYQAEQAGLRLHTSLAEELIRYTETDFFTKALVIQQTVTGGGDPTLAGGPHDLLEELIARGAPLTTVLRLVCLESCISGGLRQRDFDTFRRSILHAYGQQHLLTLTGLQKMGLLVPRAGGVGIGMGVGGSTGSVKETTNYQTARRQLHLIYEDVKESDPNDVSYVFSGYAPLSVRLVQCILHKSYLSKLSRAPAAQTASLAASSGWRGFEDAVRQVRGPTFDEIQSGDEKTAVKTRQLLNGHAHDGDASKIVIVFFLGGICRAEVAALRYLAKKLKEEGQGRRIVVCTTGVVRGDEVVGAAIEGRSFAD